MPYKDPEKQKAAMRKIMRRHRARKKKKDAELIYKMTHHSAELERFFEEKLQLEKVVWQRKYDTAMRVNVQLRRIISEKDEQLVKACE